MEKKIALKWLLGNIQCFKPLFFTVCCLSLSEYVLNYKNVLTIIEIYITFYVFLNVSNIILDAPASK